MHSWPIVEANKVIAAFNASPKDVVTFATGFGASGRPHIGSFSENVRTAMVRRAMNYMRPDISTRHVVFSDDYDAFRRVPDNLPKSMEADLGLPLTRVLDPIMGDPVFSSFGERNNSTMVDFLNDVGIDYQFISATEMYTSGGFNDALLNVLRNYEAIMDIMLPTLGEARRLTYSPILPLHPVTGRILQVPLIEYDPLSGNAIFRDDDGETHTSSMLDGGSKLQWKVDWAMRWGAIGVDYEMSGKDLIDSVKASSKIARVLGHQPPVSMTYELFLDEFDRKISKSLGNGVAVEEWLQYGSLESLAMFMFQNPRAARNLHIGLIPRMMDDYLKALTSYATQTPEERLDNPVWHIHQGNPPSFSSDVTYSLLINLASVSNATDPVVLNEYLSTYRDISDADRPLIEAMVPLVIAYCQERVFPNKVLRDPTVIEKWALVTLASLIDNWDGDKNAESYQFQIYEAGKAAVADSPDVFPTLRDYFRMVYETVFGSSDGPRLGTFVMAYGPYRTVRLLQARGGLVLPEREIQRT